jgi:acetyl/propionyl-CoA carboxylase alpha subunit
MAAKLDLAGTIHEVARLDGAAGGIRLGDRAVRVDFRALGDGAAVVTVDGRSHRVRVAARGGRIWVHAGGRAWEVRPVEAADAFGGGGASADTVLAAMPGTVVSVTAAPGDAVAAGDTIMVIESMKLETTIAAPRDGEVAEIGYAVGATFDKGAVLVRLAPAADGASGRS